MISRLHLVVFATVLTAASESIADADDPVALIQAEAKKRFGAPLSEAESNLFRCIVQGRWYKPEGSGARAIKADRIAWVCTTPKVASLVTHKGILIEGVAVEGVLDLADAKITFPLSIRSSTFLKSSTESNKIDLANAEVRSLCLDGSEIGELYGRSMKSDFDVRLGDGFRATDTVDLSNAEIGGDLNLSGGKFSKKDNGPAKG